jgi:hypothetical protein
VRAFVYIASVSRPQIIRSLFRVTIIPLGFFSVPFKVVLLLAVRESLSHFLVAHLGVNFVNVHLVMTGSLFSVQ